MSDSPWAIQNLESVGFTWRAHDRYRSEKSGTNALFQTISLIEE